MLGGTYCNHCSTFILFVVNHALHKDENTEGRGYVAELVVRRNEVAEGGYWITLRQSVRPPVRPSVRSP